MDCWPSTSTIPDFQGQPKLRRVEPRVYFDANMEEPAVVAAVNGNKYSIRWTGTLIPPATGDYVISARTGTVEPRREDQAVPRRQGSEPARTRRRAARRIGARAGAGAISVRAAADAVGGRPQVRRED